MFGQESFSGNALAVVLDSEGIDTPRMQSITRWLNLSETTFLSPPSSPEADYRVRIFTLERELPFAGHPTLGTCHAWLASGGTPRHATGIVQECGAGLIDIRRDDGRLAFAAPKLIRGGPVEPDKLDEVAAFLRIDRSAIVDAQWADNGPGWIAVMLDSAEAVLALEPAAQHRSRIDVGVVGSHPAGGPVAFELRALFTDHTGAVREDPVTGSLNASVAQWLFATGRAEHGYVAGQGTRLGCTGRVYLRRDADGGVWVGGKTVTLFEGQAHLD